MNFVPIGYSGPKKRGKKGEQRNASRKASKLALINVENMLEILATKVIANVELKSEKQIKDLVPN